MTVPKITRASALAAALIGAATWLVVPTHATVIAPRPACRHAVDDRTSVAIAVDWRTPADDDRRPLDAWCAAVGPATVRSASAPNDDAVRLDDVVVASWNVHVGGGDLPAFITALDRGDFTGGAPVTHFVLLLQEAYRAGAAVPPVADGSGWASRIDEHPPDAPRQDIVSIARTFGLSLYYVPSMRNGVVSHAGPQEDRGNAVLSTLPLTNLTAIELPFERQRRVAIGATVTAIDERGVPRHVRVGSAHLDATASAKRLRFFAAGVRARQAEALARSLDRSDDASLLGSDLNTWWGGRHESAYLTLRELFPATPEPPGATHWGGRVLDHLFVRVPRGWRAETRVVDRAFGSDHAPIIGRLIR